MKIGFFYLKKNSVLFAVPVGICFVVLNTVSAKNSLSYAEKSSCDNACLEQKALLGDGEIAYQIGNSYMYKDREKMKFWYRISAENGSVHGQHNYAHFLAIDSKSAGDCYRAIFWFSTAAKKGDTLSKRYQKKLIDLMDDKNRYKDGCSLQYQSSL
jgi:hypothetical protein